MRVLVAPDAVADVAAADDGDPPRALGAVDVAAHLVQGWAAARPADELVVLPQSTGSAGVLDVLAATLGGDREVAVARDAWGEATPSSWLRLGVTGYLDAAPLLGDPAAADAERLATAGSSAGVGDLLLAAVRAGARRVVVCVGQVGTHDAGVGALRAIAGDAEASSTAEQLRAAAEAMRGVEIVVAAATDLPLVGLSGAGAALAGRPGLDATRAQAIELDLAGIVAQIEAGAVRQRSLLGADASAERRLSRRPGAGAGGGVAFALAAMGARVLNGADVIAVETGLREASAAVDLVLTATTRLDGAALAIGVPGAVGSAAAAALVPGVAVATSVVLGRRELSGTGLAAVYPLTDPAAPGQPAARADLPTALSRRASRVATTWSR